MRNQIFTGLIAGVMLLLFASDSDAVIVYLKGQDQPVRGYLVREDTSEVVLLELKGDGTTVERTIRKSDIDGTIIVTVKPDRLAALKPSEPDGYREYAEELAEKRRDPDAQQTGIRLFLIAAHLEPERLGRSCLLGMVPLARDESERRRFQAMSYLLDPTHDRNQLKTTSVKKTTTEQLEPRFARFVVRALQLLRQNKKKEARLQARRVNMKERLPLLTDLISYEEFDEACELTCPHCRRGRAKCRECGGTGYVADADSNRITCRTCGTRGDILCTHCLGDFSHPQLSASLLRRIVQVELDSVSGGQQKAASSGILRPSWSRTVQDQDLATSLPLTLETLTEFDPRQCRYRDGNWTE